MIGAFLLTLLPLCAQGPQIPSNDGWVTDLAGMLEPRQEAALEALMESYKQGSGHEVALLTVPDLDGRPIEELALAVGRAWKIGREGKNDGAILVVSRDDRKLRIEVGRGLEGDIPDSIAGRIIRDVITPQFKAGRFYEGLHAGIVTIHSAAGGDYAQIPRKRRGERAGSALGSLFTMFILIAIFAGSRRRGRGGSVMPFLFGAAIGSSMGGRGGGLGGGGFGGGGFSGFGGGGGFSGGGASGGW